MMDFFQSMGIFGGVFTLIGIACMVWVLYDVFANQKKMSTTGQILWTIFAILFSIITAIIYYFAVYKK